MSISVITFKLIKGKMLTRVRKFAKFAFEPKYLLYTNVAISMSLSGIGDALEQKYEMVTGEAEKYDLIRTRNMSISGLTIGVLCHHWYRFLDKRMPGKGFKQVMQKVVVDQLVCSPLLILTFFVTLAILEQRNYAGFVNELRQKGWMLYAAEWVIWPPAQFINFYFLPTRFRVLYDNTISLGYDIYTSYVVNACNKQETNASDDS